jgi:threonine dehydrogenase-like Zn-dependent dehydrogenase
VLNVLDPAAEMDGSVVDRIRELTDGGEATRAVETTAVRTVLTAAVEALGPRGTLVVLGLDMATRPSPTSGPEGTTDRTGRHN